MFSYLARDIQDELAQLAQAYHQPLVQTVDLTSDDAFDPLRKTDGRYGEVCMVVRRTNGRLLTIKKNRIRPLHFACQPVESIQESAFWTR